MKKFWVFNILIVALFIVALTVFYQFSFSSEGFVYFAIAGVILSILSMINHKMNYKKKLLATNQ